jgi:hypothetical protein
VLTSAGGLTGEISTLVSIEPRTPRSHLIMDSDPESLLDRILEHLRDRH